MFLDFDSEIMNKKFKSIRKAKANEKQNKILNFYIDIF